MAGVVAIFAEFEKIFPERAGGWLVRRENGKPLRQSAAAAWQACRNPGSAPSIFSKEIR
jgi:hypothetical protein